MKEVTERPIFDLAVVVINFRTPELTINCLNSLSPDIQSLNARVVLVDNNSADGSIDKIEQAIENLAIRDKIFINRSPVNGGFSAGNNIGIKDVEAHYYLLTNSDTLIREGALHTLLDTAKKNPKIGLLAPRLEWPDGSPQESCFKYHSPWSELIHSAKTGIITKCLQKYNVPQPVSEVVRDYDWVSFASVLVRAEVFKNTGLMDEGYFMYYEDVVFCYRAKQAGWLIHYQPAAHVVHLRGGSSPLKAQVKLRKRLPRYYYESRTRFFYQVYGKKGLLLANLMWRAGWLISYARSLLSSNFVQDIPEQQGQDIWINYANPETPYVHPENYGNKA